MAIMLYVIVKYIFKIYIYIYTFTQYQIKLGKPNIIVQK